MSEDRFTRDIQGLPVADIIEAAVFQLNRAGEHLPQKIVDRFENLLRHRESNHDPRMGDRLISPRDVRSNLSDAFDRQARSLLEWAPFFAACKQGDIHSAAYVLDVRKNNLDAMTESERLEHKMIVSQGIQFAMDNHQMPFVQEVLQKKLPLTADVANRVMAYARYHRHSYHKLFDRMIEFYGDVLKDNKDPQALASYLTVALAEEVMESFPKVAVMEALVKAGADTRGVYKILPGVAPLFQPVPVTVMDCGHIGTIEELVKLEEKYNRYQLPEEKWGARLGRCALKVATFGYAGQAPAAAPLRNAL